MLDLAQVVFRMALDRVAAMAITALYASRNIVYTSTPLLDFVPSIQVRLATSMPKPFSLTSVHPRPLFPLCEGLHVACSAKKGGGLCCIRSI